ncbi:hypothetical protein F0239_07540 [Vibrio jasicida]|nr:hypothetical protein [Vibrio jasicida]
MMVAFYSCIQIHHNSKLIYHKPVNAALSGEQRRPLHLKYCAVNNKAEANQKCRALGIRLKRFFI